MIVAILIYDGFTCFSAGEYVASGSDDGRWFIWEKRTGRLIRMLYGDEAGNMFSLLTGLVGFLLVLWFSEVICFCPTVVNCIQCHPFDSVVATSGIDNTIKVRVIIL